MTEEKKVSSNHTKTKRSSEKNSTQTDKVQNKVEEKSLDKSEMPQKSKVIELGSIVIMPNGKKGKVIEEKEDNNFVVENTENSKKTYKYIYSKLELKLA